jgi:hypothetical protein
LDIPDESDPAIPMKVIHLWDGSFEGKKDREKDDSGEIDPPVFR